MHEFLSRRLLGNSLGAWLVACAIALAVIAAVWIGRSIGTRGLRRLSARTATRVDDALAYALDGTSRILVTAVGVWIGAHALDVSPAVHDALRVAASIALVIQLGLWAQRATRKGIELSQESIDDPSARTTAKGISFLARLTIWGLVALLILANLGIEVTALVAGLGIGGVAAALAVQNVLGDFIASLSIYLDRPFDIGDFIIVDDCMGTVDQVRWRTTRLRSLGGEQLVFANADLARTRIRNYRRMEERRVLLEVGIEYGLPSEKLERATDLLREAMESENGVRFDRAHFKGFGDCALLYEAVYFVLSPDYNVYMDKQQAINLGIYKRFERAGIPFAFPTQTLHLQSKGRWPVTLQERHRSDKREQRGEAEPS
jgi:small-conductance mechanosensitive channel